MIRLRTAGRFPFVSLRKSPSQPIYTVCVVILVEAVGGRGMGILVLALVPDGPSSSVRFSSRGKELLIEVVTQRSEVVWILNGLLYFLRAPCPAHGRWITRRSEGAVR